jgi:30S ribosomal protein S31
MGKGDKKTKRGKISRGTTGKTRPKTANSNKAKKQREEKKAAAAARKG